MWSPIEHVQLENATERKQEDMDIYVCNSLTILCHLLFSREQQRLNTPVLQRTPDVERKLSSPFVTGPLPAKIQGHLRAGKSNVD